jgi:hypothetical protein
MFYSTTILNRDQANDFIQKHIQKNIKVLDITKDYEDDIYFIKLSSGSLFNKIETSWQFRPTLTWTDQLLGSHNLGLCFGEFPVPGTNKRLDFYEFDQEYMIKANDIVWEAIQKWEAKSPY